MPVGDPNQDFIIEVSGLTKRSEIYLLSHISFEVRQGSFLASSGLMALGAPQRLAEIKEE